MRYLELILPAIAFLLLLITAAIEAVRDRDVTKLALIFSWISTTWLYFMWKKRAINTQDMLLEMFSEGGIYIKKENRIIKHPNPEEFESTESKSN